MNTKGSVTVLFLCLPTLLTVTDCSKCQTNKLEGDSLTFKLADTQLRDDDRFTIKKDNKILVVPKRNKKQKGPGIVKNEFLELQHVNLRDSGTYSVEVFDVTGKRIKSYSEIVCVYAKVPKPRVNITCQNEKVDFRCDVEGDKGLSFSWHKNGRDIKMNVINFSTNIEENKSNYTCTAQNPVHNSKSDPVEEACFKSATLFGFDFWLMLGLLAGGGGLVLLLIIVLVTVTCRACKRREKQQQVVFRLSNLHTTPPPGYQKSKHTTRGDFHHQPNPRKMAQIKKHGGPL